MRRLCTASLLTISLSSCASPATPAGESTAAKPTGEAKAKPKLDAKSSDTKAADAEMTPTPTPAVEVTPEPPSYLYRNKDQLQGTLSCVPERSEIPLPVEVEERLIIEYYS